MFYYVMDGTDHWEVLSPKDIVPGTNIFGMPVDQSGTMAAAAPDGFRIIVSPEYYQDFLNDPNWKVYQNYIEPVDYDPTAKKEDFRLDGLTYSYMTSPGGIVQASQTVSQDVSWWSAPRIASEALILLVGMAGLEPVAQLSNIVGMYFTDKVIRGFSQETVDILVRALWYQIYANAAAGVAFDYFPISIKDHLGDLQRFSANATTAACISKACLHVEYISTTDERW